MHAKITIKSNKVTPLMVFFYDLGPFDRFISRKIETELGLITTTASQ